MDYHHNFCICFYQYEFCHYCYTRTVVIVVIVAVAAISSSSIVAIAICSLGSSKIRFTMHLHRKAAAQGAQIDPNQFIGNTAEAESPDEFVHPADLSSLGPLP